MWLDTRGGGEESLDLCGVVLSVGTLVLQPSKALNSTR